MRHDFSGVARALKNEGLTLVGITAGSHSMGIYELKVQDLEENAIPPGMSYGDMVEGYIKSCTRSEALAILKDIELKITQQEQKP